MEAPRFEMRFNDTQRNEITVAVNIRTKSIEIKTARDHIVIAWSNLNLVVDFINAVRKITSSD